MRKLLAVWVGKALFTVGKILNKRTTSAPGEYALRICPNLLKDLNKYVKKGIIISCGTNGKTTTNNLLCSTLEAQGYKVMCNRIGANMTSGVASAFIESLNLLGKSNADYACFEVDEAYTPIIFSYFKPDVFIVTNLFRDQLDRYGETDTTAAKIQQAINMSESTKLVLNGDDPLCVQFGRDRNSFYYGVDERVTDQNEVTGEGKFCPLCGSELQYEYFHYNQLGIFSCPSCGFKRPKLDFAVTNVKLGQSTEFCVNSTPVTSSQRGFYNIYNMAAVYGALNVLGENTEDFTSLLSGYKPQIGRMQEFKFKNKTVILNLAKNPAGFNQAIAAVNTDTRKKDVIIAVNDLTGDGKDVSWLWDVDFEKLQNDNLNAITATGRRKWDLAVRFKYVDIPVSVLDMEEAVRAALETESEVVYAVVNYTMMFPAEGILKKLQKELG